MKTIQSVMNATRSMNKGEMMPRKYKKEYRGEDKPGISKADVIKRLTKEYGDKYAIGHIDAFITECRTNGTFKEDCDYWRYRPHKEGDPGIPSFWYEYESIESMLVNAVKERGVKNSFIYKKLGIGKQGFETFRKKLEATLFRQGKEAHFKKIEELYPDTVQDVGEYYWDNFEFVDGKLKRITPSPYGRYQFSEKMVAEMKVLYPILIDGKRGRPKQKPPKGPPRISRE